MGLDAFVACRCFTDGLVSPPPCAVITDPDTGLIELVDEDDTRWADFDDWRSGACPHAEQEIAAERIGNWAGVRSFQVMLTYYARTLAPHLLGEWVGISNGGTVQPGTAAVMAHELDKLSNVSVPTVRLRDANAQVWREFTVADVHHGWAECYRGPRLALTLTDLSGFIDVHIDGRPAGRTVGFETEDDGATQRWITVPDFGRFRGAPDEHVVMPSSVSTHRATVSFIESEQWIIDALRRLFQASIDTGNPVCWS